MSITPTQFGLFICCGTVSHQAFLKETLILHLQLYECMEIARKTRIRKLNKEFFKTGFQPKELNV